MTTQRPPSPGDERLGFLSRAGLEHLTWEAVDREAVIARLVKVVPPGKALRKYETRAPDPAGRVKPELTEDEKIYSGARALAVQALHGLVDSGRAEWVELEDAKKGKGIRLRERRADVAAAKAAGEPCPACHRPFTSAPQKAGLKTKAKTYGTVIEFPLERRLARQDERMTR